jgi:stage II sporulation protein M
LKIMKLKEWKQLFLSMRHYLIASALVLILGIILGYSDSNAFDKLINAQLKQMQTIAEGLKLSDHLQWALFTKIILNNLLVSAMVILFGFFFGVIPLYFLISTGLLLGYLAANLSEGETIFHLLISILPHGIIEIPALILACAVGLRLGFLMIESFGSLFNLERKERYQAKLRNFFKHLIPLLALIAGLMLLAAIIESTVTFALLKII